MTTKWSVILNRIDGAFQVWKEWRGSVVTSSTGTPDAGSIPMLGPDGKLDPSITASTIELSTDGVLNPVQDVLNLKGGANIGLAADNSGGVTISATGELSTAFNLIDSGVNTTSSMTVSSGASLQASDGGVINATEINGVPITGVLSHAGQIPISQPGNTGAIWADPLVQGLQAEGTTASTINPVLIGGKDASGNLKDLVLDANGNLAVNVENFPTQPSVFKTGQFTQTGNSIIWTPATDKRFRLLKYMIEGTLNLSQTAQGVLTISFQDGNSPTPFAHDVYVPSTAMKYNVTYQSGWIDLGGIGFLSNTTNNALNVNLTASLTAGNFRIIVAGIEE